MDANHQESPQYLRISTAAALTLDFKKGRFYRNAKLYCINLLQVYSNGCMANCAYCGLSGKRQNFKEKSFIRVEWPIYRLEEIVERMETYQDKFARICISMVTRRSAPGDVIEIIEKIRLKLDTPISVLISPTATTDSDLVRFKEMGVNKIGVAIDTATKEIFDKYRGRGVKGPHRWETYWNAYKTSLRIFGNKNAGVHLIVGLGETEKEMAEAIQKARDLGGGTHLFSFYPEAGSQMESQPPPPIGQYRRIQLARYLIDEGIATVANFTFYPSGHIMDFGISQDELKEIINSGLPFMTSGCVGKDGRVACNRPYANFPPPHIRNYPFDLDVEDIKLVERELEK